LLSDVEESTAQGAVCDRWELVQQMGGDTRSQTLQSPARGSSRNLSLYYKTSIFVASTFA